MAVPPITQTPVSKPGSSSSSGLLAASKLPAMATRSSTLATRKIMCVLHWLRMSLFTRAGRWVEITRPMLNFLPSDAMAKIASNEGRVRVSQPVCCSGA